MEIDTGTTELLCSVRDGVALITLNRPEARNAMSDKLTPALRTQIKERGEDIYNHIEANLHWELFGYLGKLQPTVYVLRRLT